MTNPGENPRPLTTADGQPAPDFLNTPAIAGEPLLSGDAPQAAPASTGEQQIPAPTGESEPRGSAWGDSPSPWGARQDVFGRNGQPSPFEPGYQGESLGDGESGAVAALRGEAEPAPAPEPTPASEPEPTSTHSFFGAPTPERTPASEPTDPDDLFQDFSDTPAQQGTTTSSEDLDVPDFLNTNGANTPPEPATATAGDSLLGGAFTRQSGSTTTTPPAGSLPPLPRRPRPATPAATGTNPLPHTPLATPYAGSPAALAAPRSPQRRPAGGVPPAPSHPPAPAPANTAPTAPRPEDHPLHGYLLGVEQKAGELGVDPVDLLVHETNRARQAFAKEVARRGSSLVGGGKDLEAARDAYQQVVDAQAIAAIGAINASRPVYDQLDQDGIRVLSILGNLGDGGSIKGEEEKLAEQIRNQSLMRAGYTAQKTTESLGASDELNFNMVTGVTEPTGFKGAKLRVLRALDEMGNTRKGKITRAALLASAGAGAVMLTTVAAAATGGVGLLAAVGSTRVAKAIYATKISNGTGENKATANYDEAVEGIEARRNGADTSHIDNYNFGSILNDEIGYATKERRSARKRAAIAGGLAMAGSGIGALAQEFLPSLTGGSVEAHSGTGAHDAKPEPTPTHTTPPHTGGGAGETDGSHPGGSNGNHDSNPGTGSDHESGATDTNPDATKIHPGSTGTLYGDFTEAGIGFDKVANAANHLIDKGELGKHVIGGNPNNYYYTGGSRAEIEAAIFKQMVAEGSIDADDFTLAS